MGAKKKDKDAAIMAEAIEKKKLVFFSIKVVGYKVGEKHFRSRNMLKIIMQPLAY